MTPNDESQALSTHGTLTQVERLLRDVRVCLEDRGFRWGFIPLKTSTVQGGYANRDRELLTNEHHTAESNLNVPKNHRDDYHTAIIAVAFLPSPSDELEDRLLSTTLGRPSS